MNIDPLTRFYTIHLHRITARAPMTVAQVERDRRTNGRTVRAATRLAEIRFRRALRDADMVRVGALEVDYEVPTRLGNGRRLPRTTALIVHVTGRAADAAHITPDEASWYDHLCLPPYVDVIDVVRRTRAT